MRCINVSLLKRGMLVVSLVSVLTALAGGQTLPSKDNTATKIQDEALHTLQDYLRLRLQNADWKDYSRFVTWPDEPGWDCNWVVSKYELGVPRETETKAIVAATYKRLGLFCYDFEFKPSAKTVKIEYQLVNGPNGWKLSGPIPDYPDIRADVLIKSLRTSAENPRESVERRVEFNATVRKVEDTLHRSNASQ